GLPWLTRRISSPQSSVPRAACPPVFRRSPNTGGQAARGTPDTPSGRRFAVANAKDLITSARAVQGMQYYSDNATTNAKPTTLITPGSAAIEKYCRRRFVSKSYDELYNGNGDRRLMLRQYPIQSVQSVRYRPVTVLKVINNATAQNQQARVQ